MYDENHIYDACNPVTLSKRYSSVYSARQAATMNVIELKHLGCAYGIRMPIILIKAYIALLQEFLGVKDDARMSDDSVSELSKLIYEDYKMLKLSEIDLVFKNIKKGKYGKVYGRIDPIYIQDAFRVYFDEERLSALRSLPSEDDGYLFEVNKETIEFAKKYVDNVHGIDNEQKEKMIEATKQSVKELVASGLSEKEAYNNLLDENKRNKYALLHILSLMEL